MRRRTAFVATLAATIWLGMPALVRASDTAASNGSGGTTPPGSGSTTTISWNPVVQCTAEENWDLFQLLECLALGLDSEYNCVPIGTVVGEGVGEVQELAGLPQRICHDVPRGRSDYRVLLLTNPPGLDVRRREATADGSYEADSFLIAEDDPNIQWTRLRVDRPGLEGRILEIREQPSGGKVEIFVNGRTISVETRAIQTPTQVTNALIAGLQAQGFSTSLIGKFIVVSAHRESLPGEPAEITYVAFRSTDPGIKTSELRLARPGVEPARSVVGGIEEAR